MKFCRSCEVLKSVKKLWYLPVKTALPRDVLIHLLILSIHPVEWICPSWKTISQIYSTSDIYIFIPDIQRSESQRCYAATDPTKWLDCINCDSALSFTLETMSEK
jgi:hypothetical protein